MEGNSFSSFLITVAPLIMIFLIFWLLLIRPQKKKDEKIQEMRKGVQVGDEIVTIGGIVGKVLSVKEDTIVVYCGADKTKMEFKKWAVSEVTKKSEKAAAAAPAEVEEAPKKKFKKLTKKEDAETPAE